MANNISTFNDSITFYFKNKKIKYKIRSDYVRNDRSKTNR